MYKKNDLPDLRTDKEKLDSLEDRLERHDIFMRNNIDNNSVEAIYILYDCAVKQLLDLSYNILDKYDTVEDKLKVHEAYDKLTAKERLESKYED